ncbi:AtpZ/AtpI family protein [Planctomycetota bacterium]|nr:AtpZ/AtpI family protein [Planctomycetota bacterium]
MPAKDLNKVLSMSHLGITFVLMVAGSAFLGVKADEHFGTTPGLTFLGGLIGFGASFAYLYREVYGREQSGDPGSKQDRES